MTIRNQKILFVTVKVVAPFAFFLLAADTHASTTQRPDTQHPKQSEQRRPGQPPAYMPQSDAFQTAAEHSMHMGIYQMVYGPYGIETDGAGRAQREAAEAIEECLKTACSEEKQKRVMQALISFNTVSEIRRQMLVNTTNKKNIASINAGEEKSLARWQTVGRGLDLSGVKSGGAISKNTTGASKQKDIIRGHGTARNEPYFQLDSNSVVVDATEKEILGNEFLQNYKAFLRDSTTFDANDAKNQQRFYKYVQARPSNAQGGDAAYVFSDKPELGNKKRFLEVAQEQNAPNIRALVRENIENIRDAKDINPSQHGLGVTAFIEDEKEIRPHLPQGKDPSDRGVRHLANLRAVNERVNSAFKKAAEKLQKQKNLGGREISSLPADKSKKVGQIEATLDPQNFDEFLERIWPSAETRQKILSDSRGNDPK